MHIQITPICFIINRLIIKEIIIKKLIFISLILLKTVISHLYRTDKEEIKILKAFSINCITNMKNNLSVSEVNYFKQQFDTVFC